MKPNTQWLLVALCIASLALAACGPASSTTEVGESPAKVDHLEGAQPSRVTLTEDAAKHLDLQTAKVSNMTIGGKLGKAIPYSAIVYDTEGKTWTYVESEPEVFLRTPISVDMVKGDLALLTDGPVTDSVVVTVGAEELFGAETEFQEE